MSPLTVSRPLCLIPLRLCLFECPFKALDVAVESFDDTGDVAGDSTSHDTSGITSGLTSVITGGLPIDLEPFGRDGNTGLAVVAGLLWPSSPDCQPLRARRADTE